MRPACFEISCVVELGGASNQAAPHSLAAAGQLLLRHVKRLRQDGMRVQARWRRKVAPRCASLDSIELNYG